MHFNSSKRSQHGMDENVGVKALILSRKLKIKSSTESEEQKETEGKDKGLDWFTPKLGKER